MHSVVSVGFFSLVKRRIYNQDHIGPGLLMEEAGIPTEKAPTRGKYSKPRGGGLYHVVELWIEDWKKCPSLKDNCCCSNSKLIPHLLLRDVIEDLEYWNSLSPIDYFLGSHGWQAVRIAHLTIVDMACLLADTTRIYICTD